MIPQVEKAIKEKLETILVDRKKVKVFDHTLEGQLWTDVYPSISYNALPPVFDENRFLFGEKIKQPAGVPVSVDYGSETLTGTTKNTSRKHPEPWQLPYEIQLWSKNRSHLNQMQESLMILFPPKGTLRIVDEFSATRYLQTYFQNVVSLDSLDRRVEGERELRRAYTYLVEAWLEIDRPVEQQVITQEPDLTLTKV